MVEAPEPPSSAPKAKPFRWGWAVFDLLAVVLVVAVVGRWLALRDQARSLVPAASKIKVMNAQRAPGLETIYTLSSEDHQRVLDLFRTGRKERHLKWAWAGGIRFVTRGGAKGGVDIFVDGEAAPCIFSIGDQFYRAEKSAREVLQVLEDCCRRATKARRAR